MSVCAVATADWLPQAFHQSLKAINQFPGEREECIADMGNALPVRLTVKL